MRIAVCIKRVPDTSSRIRTAADGKGIDTSDLKFILNPPDETALEEGLRLREKLGGELEAVSLGPDGSREVLRQALALGADRATLLLADSPAGLELDPRQCALALASHLRKDAPDVVIFGKMTADGQGAQVGPLVARELGIPCVGEVFQLEWTGEHFRFHHQIDGQVEVVEAPPPVAFTTHRALNVPRHPGIKGILAARKKPIQIIESGLFPPSMELLSVEPPAPRKPCRIIGNGPGAVDALLNLLKKEKLI